MPRTRTRRPRKRLEGPAAQMAELMDALANPVRPTRRRKTAKKKTRAKATAPRRKASATPKRGTGTRRKSAPRKRVAAARRNPRRPSNTKWWRFTLYGSRGALVARAVGKGNELEAANEGNKLARRQGVQRVVLEGPYASMQKAL